MEYVSQNWSLHNKIIRPDDTSSDSAKAQQTWTNSLGVSYAAPSFIERKQLITNASASFVEIGVCKGWWKNEVECHQVGYGILEQDIVWHKQDSGLIKVRSSLARANTIVDSLTQQLGDIDLGIGENMVSDEEWSLLHTEDLENALTTALEAIRSMKSASEPFDGPGSGEDIAEDTPATGWTPEEDDGEVTSYDNEAHLRAVKADNYPLDQFDQGDISLDYGQFPPPPWELTNGDVAPISARNDPSWGSATRSYCDKLAQNNVASTHEQSSKINNGLDNANGDYGLRPSYQPTPAVSQVQRPSTSFRYNLAPADPGMPTNCWPYGDTGNFAYGAHSASIGRWPYPVQPLYTAQPPVSSNSNQGQMMPIKRSNGARRLADVLAEKDEEARIKLEQQLTDSLGQPATTAQYTNNMGINRTGASLRSPFHPVTVQVAGQNTNEPPITAYRSDIPPWANIANTEQPAVAPPSSISYRQPAMSTLYGPPPTFGNLAPPLDAAPPVAPLRSSSHLHRRQRRSSRESASSESTVPLYGRRRRLAQSSGNSQAPPPEAARHVGLRETGMDYGEWAAPNYGNWGAPPAPAPATTAQNGVWDTPAPAARPVHSGWTPKSIQPGQSASQW